MQKFNNQVSVRRKKILIAMFTDLSRAPRVLKQIEFLKSSYDIWTAGFNKPNRDDNINHITLFRPTGHRISQKILNAILMTINNYWDLPLIKVNLPILINDLCSHNFDLVICHDPILLPLCTLISQKMNSKLIFDAHEYTPRQSEDNITDHLIRNRYWDSLCRKYMKKSDINITVCRGIAEEYEKNYGVHFDVINNTPFYFELTPSPTDKNKIKLIHHGNAHPSRRTEEMIKLMKKLDNRFYLDLVLINDGSRYYKKILNLGSNNPRISFPKPVLTKDIPFLLNNYDIGLYMLYPSSFNTRMALPNKLFEFIQGRLAIAIWPSPEMARVIIEYGCGIVSDDFTIESIAKRLNSLTAEDIMRFKMNSNKAARELCAENNRTKFMSIVEKLIGL